jgi:hypothetical protein
LVDKRILSAVCPVPAKGLVVVNGKTDKERLASTGGREYSPGQSSGMKNVE